MYKVNQMDFNLTSDNVFSNNFIVPPSESKI